MKPLHTNHCGVSFITGAEVHVMHYIELAVIVAKRLLEDVFSLIYSEVSQKGLWILLFLWYLAKALYMGEIMKDKLHE